MSEVALEISGRVARITIDRPARRNALSPEVTRGLLDALGSAESDDSVAVAVLTGAGDRAFCAGADLGTMAGVGGIAAHYDRAAIGELLQRLRAARMPVVARVNGYALAGGFGLMLACDLAIACDDVEFGMPEIDVGLWPFMISAVVQRHMPRRIALELMLTGRRMTAAEALALGILNRVVARTELDAAVDGLVGDILSKSPLIAALGKRSFNRAEDMELGAALDYLAGMLTVASRSEDAAEGVAAFLEKRKPRWTGR